MSEHRFRDLVQEAEAASAAADWDHASSAWCEVRDFAARHGQLELARIAAARAVDAFRRDDRPAGVLSSLREALALAEGEGPREMLEIQLGAALSDAGQLDLAERQLASRLGGVQGLPLGILLDTLAGVRMARGDLVGLREVLRMLEQVAEGPVLYAWRFRKAQVDRLDGRLDEAAETLAACAHDMQEVPGAGGAAAAACLELAELAMDRGDAAEAFELYGSAAELWTAAGRRSGLFCAEAGRAEAALQMGASVLPRLLDKPVDYARERGLPVLEARLRLARGLARAEAEVAGADDDLVEAAALAARAGALFLVGRARYARWKLGLCGPEQLRLATGELMGHQLPWARAALALAGLLATENPGEALFLAAAAQVRFAAMGLAADEEEARGLVQRLTG